MLEICPAWWDDWENAYELYNIGGGSDYFWLTPSDALIFGLPSADGAPAGSRYKIRFTPWDGSAAVEAFLPLGASGASGVVEFPLYLDGLGAVRTGCYVVTVDGGPSNVYSRLIPENPTPAMGEGYCIDTNTPPEVSVGDDRVLGWAYSNGRLPEHGYALKESAGTETSSPQFAMHFGFDHRYLLSDEVLLVQVTFEPLDGGAAEFFELPVHGVAGGFLVDPFTADGGRRHGVYTIAPPASSPSGQRLVTSAVPGSSEFYADTSWYPVDGESPPPENFRLGWGSSYYEGGPPQALPVLASNQGSQSWMATSWLLGVDQSAGVLPAGAQVVIDMTLTPADDSPLRMRQFMGAEINEDFFFHQNDVSFNPPIYGVYEFTGTCNGVPFLNKLVCTATPEEWGYGMVVFYAEDLPPVVGQFWMEFVNTEEVAV